MKKIELKINDFNLFVDVMKHTSKIVDAAKLELDETGFSIYGARGQMARCEIESNSIYSSEKTSFMLDNIQNFVKILNTAKELHEDDYIGFTLEYDDPFIRISSKKIKTKLHTCNDSEMIELWITKKIQTKMNPTIEFTTTSEMISRVNRHSFIFSNPSDLRVYLSTKDDMENNALYATLGNKENNINNEITFKFGLINSGSLKKDQNIILDLDRMNILNVGNSSEVKVSLMDVGALVSKIHMTGKNDSYFNMKVYTAPLKN